MNGKGLKIGIVVSRWNADVADALLEECRAALLATGVREKDIIVFEVPGAYELPFAARTLIEREKVDAVVCLGCLIKGETMHFEYIAEAVSNGIMQVGLTTKIPVIFGVLTCITNEQAEARASGPHSHGYPWGQTAVEMALMRRGKVKGKKKKK